MQTVTTFNMKSPANNKTLNGHETRLATHYAYNATYARHISQLGQRKWGGMIIHSPKSGDLSPLSPTCSDAYDTKPLSVLSHTPGLSPVSTTRVDG